MLDRVEFKHFKALADVSVELAPLTVLVGANGAGKTSVLEGIEILGRITRDVILAKERIDPTEALARFDLAHMLTVDLEGTARVTTRLSPALGLAVDLDRGGVMVATGPGAFEAMTTTWSRSSGLPIDTSNALLPLRSSPLRSCTRLQLDPHALAAPSHIGDDVGPPRLAEDGSGLASIIAYLLGTRSSALDRIEADLHRIVPQIGRLRVNPTRIQRREQEILTVNDEHLTRWVNRAYVGSSLEAEIAGRGYVPAHMLSDGTLITLGILAVLHGPTPPALLLLDDIDRGLHPTAQRTLVACLRSLRAQRPSLQIVCTSHSPYFLDALEPEEVRVMKLDADGHAHCKKLTEHPEWPEWAGSMTAGEFWSSFGEDWVYGEEPASAS